VRVQADVRAPRVLTLARRRCAGGERALLIAAKVGREDLVELIAGFKADVNAGDASWRTALHGASEAGHLAVVQFLVKVGANVKAKEESVSLKRETLTRAQTDT
jgi:ankyrin repeat protein